jgi:hypothetical protein
VTLGLGATQQFKSTISGTTNSNVTWQVDGVTGGKSTNGTISTDGLYTAPAAVPNPATVTVTAISQANTTDIANAALTLTSDVLVSVIPASVDLQLGKTQQFAATVTGTTNSAVTWQAGGVSGGNSSFGTISSRGLYTAPTTVSGPLPAAVSITAVSQVDKTKSGTAGVTLHSSTSVAVSPNAASVHTFGSQQFTVTVTGTSNASVTWEVNGVAGGSSTTGTISITGLYAAPHSVPTSGKNGKSVATTVTVTAVSQADSTAFGSVAVTVVPPNQSQQNVPTTLGVSGSNANDSNTSSPTTCCGGTLGALVSRGGNQYILSNSHILARNDDASLGEPIIQPGLIDSSCSSAASNTVAHLSQFVNLENPPPSQPLVDAALAQVISGEVDPQGTILELGGSNNGGLPTDGPPHAGSGVAPLIAVNAHNGLVAKSGRSTGLTCSSIAAINVTANIQYQKGCGAGATFTATFNDLVDIHDSAFSAEGDSGSIIVTQDGSDPVALLVASSDTDTLGNAVPDVLSALADPLTGERPVFVGGGTTHPVAACSLPGPQAAAARAQRAVLQQSRPRIEQLQAATGIRDLHASELLSHPAVLALGVGASADRDGEAAILLLVKKGLARNDLPAQVDGTRTRIIESEIFSSHPVLSVAESTALEESAQLVSGLSAVPALEITRARAVQAEHLASLMALAGVQGVGITSSADSPGEAAIAIFLVRGAPQETIPPVIDGLRTRIRESTLFRAGSNKKSQQNICSPSSAKKKSGKITDLNRRAADAAL